MDKFGGRKFLVLLLMLTAGALADHYSQHGLTNNLAYLMLGLYAAFTAGNVGITLSALKNGNTPLVLPPDAPESQPAVAEEPAEDFQAPTSQNVDLEPVQQSLARLEASVGQVMASIPPQNQSLGFLVQAEQRRQMQEITG